MDISAKQLFFVYLFLLLPFDIQGQLADHSGPCVFAGGALNAVSVSFQTPRLPLGHPGFFLRPCMVLNTCVYRRHP